MKTEKIYTYAYWLIILAGIAVRLAVYLQNRSLFLDEANLARNLAERSFGDLLLPLSYQQAAPPLFSITTKSVTLLFGNTEFALRFLPLLAGIGSLILFYSILRRLLPWGIPFVFAIWIIAFHQGLLHYSTECKQYSTDVFCTLLLIRLALKKTDWSSTRQTLGWLLLGILSIVFSMPAVFILPGIALFFLLQYWTRHKAISTRIGIVLLGWGITFGLYYFLMLKPQVGSQQLQAYHTDFFLPLLPTSVEEWNQFGFLLHQILKDFAGPTVMGLLVGGVGFGVGVFVLVRKKKHYGILLLTPLVATLIASGMHYYSLISRLILFLVPSLVIVWALGWQFLLKIVFPRAQVFGWALMLLLVSLHTSYKYFWQPFQIEEIRPALAFLEEQAKEDIQLYLSPWAIPAYRYYTEHHEEPFKLSIEEVSAPNTTQRAWLFYNHLIAESERKKYHQDLERWREAGNVSEVYQGPGVRILLFQKPK